MNLKSYFTYNNLFQINSAVVSPQEKVFFIGGIVLLLLAIVLKIAGKLAPTPTDSKYRNKFYRLFLTIGIAQVFWFLCRYENVKFFGSHFVAMLIVLIGIIWFVWILLKILKNYKTEKVVWEKEQLRMKYLPK